MPGHFCYPRSTLFLPAANTRAMAKTLTLDMDAVIFDLEDSVGQSAKRTARQNLSAFFTNHPLTVFTRVIRVNALSGPLGFEDIEQARDICPDAVLLPKVEKPETVEQAAAMLQSGKPGRPALWALIETPEGILRAPSIAVHPAVTTLVVGPNDLAAATDVKPGTGRVNLHPWLMQIVLAAKASQRCVLDGVYNNFADKDGFAKECRQAADMGFDGKTLIHPGQIAAANEAFRPTQEDIAKARAIIAAFREPQNRQKGVISSGGNMIERLHLIKAEKLLKKSGIKP